MKTGLLSVATLASAAMIAQANAGDYRAGGGGFHGGAVAHAAPAARAPARAGGLSSMHPMPTRSFGGRMIYPGQRYASFGMRPYRPTVFRHPSIYPGRATFTRSVRTLLQRSTKLIALIVSHDLRITEIKPLPACGISEIPAANFGMETTIFVLTGKNTCSHSVRGIGTVTGTARETIGGMVIAAASLMGRG